MPLESCMILLDNSQYMRNGDYLPTRLSAQQDAANLLVSHKTQSNPESTVGVILMNGGCFTAGVELLVSPTDDVGKILSALHAIPLRGEGDMESGVDVPASVQVASLALKHRRNKNGQQRIVMFVGSPLSKDVDKKIMVKAGKALKKNNVKIDVVAMGEWEENQDKLEALVDAANGSGSNDGGEEKSCHLITIPAGTLPSDILIGSPVIHGGDASMAMGGIGGAGGSGGAGGGGGGGNDFVEYGGVDPNLDPELAMALRISMEEERARQERIARETQQQQQQQQQQEVKQEEARGGTPGDNVEEEEDVQMEDAPKVEQGNGVDATAANDDIGDEDAMLQQALAMSMADAQVQDQEQNQHDKEDDDGDDDDDDDAAMQMALAMSMAADNHQDSTREHGLQQQQQQQFQDPEFVNQLLGSLPGVDPNDSSLQSALENLEKANQQDKKEKQDKKDEDEKDTE
mmetsp:Transcript_9046/g.17059  ORF Transcript_9046/g.17059 Transcript_9046/m.17059 type:complete len:459 (+) Transcript_9046:143-1519(+)|eukprot:CAMPEP_0176486502 /NCGR_PEP_ID=MMETSP0200_2-20121128/5600_1 /TAXON_ID=947934 /ORGANISM="Chaetoceros sp., Strain GSL56" /LENGTH=458 /DNA_ID=CAMNT_0017883203 /DNA_START=208 /DNA_END=1584 /DNA_ORIENTATION=+